MSACPGKPVGIEIHEFQLSYPIISHMVKVGQDYGVLRDSVYASFCIFMHERRVPGVVVCAPLVGSLSRNLESLSEMVVN